MMTFEQMVDAVEENNRINEGKWNDWDSVEHLEEIYGSLIKDSNSYAYKSFLSTLIRDNGENLNTYLDAYECLEYGHSFFRK